MVIAYPARDDVSLYFHIPFCKKKCGYCHFFVVKDEQSLHASLLNGFLFEIEQAAIRGKTLKSIYFGGGTPSLFDPKYIDTLINAVQKVLEVSDQTEITMEFNPESCSKEMFALFKKAGINRASIGIQSFDDALLKTLTREHSSIKGQRAVLDAFDAGIENITIDLMYEVPKETRKSWTETLKTAVTLPISHLSLYNLTFEEGTAFYRKKNALSLLLPSDEDATDMLLEAIDTLNTNGLSQYEISAFAKEGFHSCHNTGYWLGREFFGFGPSAFSYLAGKRLRNVENLKRYFELCQNGKLPMDFEEELQDAEKLRELFTINLRMNQGVLLKEFQRLRGELPEEMERTLCNLKQEGFIRQDDASVTLTDRGRLFFNNVASALI